MATEVVMPKLGLTMEKGTIGAWLVEEGKEVGKGQPLLEVITDKVTMEVEAQASGVLRKILVPAGEEVPVSVPIGIIGSAEEDISAWTAKRSAPSVAGSPLSVGESKAVEAGIPSSASGERQRHRASPKARKMAAEVRVDLGQVEGSGPGGRIVSADVEAFLVRRPQAGLPPTAEGGALVELTRPQQVAAERLTASYQQVPHIHLHMRVSAVWLQQFRAGYQLEGKKITYNDLLVKATARSLGEFPRLNSVFEDGKVRQLEQVNIGIATDTPQGLLVPVVHQVPEKSIEEIAAESARLIDGARQGSLRPDDMDGGTFTVTNLGMFGISQFTAIINPPQVAILAVGAIEKQVVALENDALAVRPQLILGLAADHRAVDGALAARFLQRLKEIVETPGLLG